MWDTGLPEGEHKDVSCTQGTFKPLTQVAASVVTQVPENPRIKEPQKPWIKCSFCKQIFQEMKQTISISLSDETVTRIDSL